MSDETRDPREAVLVGIINTGIQSGQWKEGWTNEALARLDDADPRLAMWGELVEALEYIGRVTYGTELSQTPEEQLSVIWSHFSAHQRKARDILTRARALDATSDGGTA